MNKRKRSFHFSITFSIFAGTIALAAMPVMGGDAQEIIEDIVRNSRNNSAAAAKLLETAKLLVDEPNIQISICEKAYEYGIKSPAGYPSAIEALDLLSKLTPAKIDTWQKMRLEVYRIRYARSNKKEKRQYGQLLVELLVSEGQKHGQAHHWSDAAGLYNEANSLATILRLDNSDEIHNQLRIAKSLHRLQDRAERLINDLAKDPDNVKIRTKLIQLYLINFNSPQKAAKYINDDCDETLRTNIPLAAKPVSELQEPACLELGRWYHALVEEAATKTSKTWMLKRAQEYLDRYMVLHVKKDSLRLKASIELTRIKEELEKLDPPPKLPRGTIQVLTFDKMHWSKKGNTYYIKDVSGKGRHATAFNVTATKGFVGQAAQLSGKSFIDTQIRFSASPRTFVFWAKIKEKSSAAMLLGLTDKDWSNRFYFGFDEKKGDMGLGLGDSQCENESKGIKADGQWHHYALLWNGKKMLLCIDGVPKATKDGRANPKGTYYIGACNVGGNSRYSCHGLIDDVAIFDRVLSRQEIRTIIKMGKKGQPLAK